MKPQTDHPFLKISHFDSTAIQAAYPGMSTVQLEPGPIEGWIHSVSVDQFQINTGSLNRTTLYEGAYNKGMINVGFILDPESTAVVQGHEYEAGTVSIDIGDIPMHETFPGNMVWAAINVPEPLLLKELNSHRHTLLANRHLTLTGPRQELDPLITLTHLSMNRKTGFRNTDVRRLSSRFRSAVCELLRSRLNQNSHELPYADGDKFLMHVVKVSQRLSQNKGHERLDLVEICDATGMKSRTLQKHFNTLYGVGPTDYFRIRRLNDVRNELIKADPRSRRVGEIAARWGFDHLGRFAGSYRRMFNESPRQTLCRATESKAATVPTVAHLGKTN